MRVLAAVILLTLSFQTLSSSDAKSNKFLIDSVVGQIGDFVILESDLKSCRSCSSLSGRHCSVFGYLLESVESLPKETRRRFELMNREAAQIEGAFMKLSNKRGRESNVSILARVFWLLRDSILTEARDKLDVSRVAKLAVGDVIKPQSNFHIELKVFSLEDESQLDGFYSQTWSELVKNSHEDLGKIRETDLDSVVWSVVGGLTPKTCSAPLISSDQIIKIFCVVNRDRKLKLSDFPAESVNLAVLNLATEILLKETERFCGSALRELGFESFE